MLFSRTSLSSEETQKVFLLNKEAVHMIDDFFWNMGFRNAEAAAKVYARIVVIVQRILIVVIIPTGTTGLGHL